MKSRAKSETVKLLPTPRIKPAVDPEEIARREKIAAAHAMAERTHRSLSIACIPPRYAAACFEIAGQANRPRHYVEAIERLKKLTMEPGSVALVGARGVGKTFLACATVRLACERGMRAVYKRASDFFVELKDSFRDGGKTQAAIIEYYASPELLVLDEMQVRSDSDWENVMLTDLIDRRYGACKSTLFITNLTAGEFAKRVGESITSRVSETGGVIVCDWLSFRRTGVQ